MSALTCSEVRELAPELALGILGGAERAEVLLHVNGCARCQAYVAELTEAADAHPATRAGGGTAGRVRVAGAPPPGRGPPSVAPALGGVDRGGGRGGGDREHHDRAGGGVRRHHVGRGHAATTARVPGAPVAVAMEGGVDSAARRVGVREQPPRCRRRPSTTASRPATTGCRCEPSKGAADVDRHHDRRSRSRFVDRAQRRAARRRCPHRAGRRHGPPGVSRNGAHR